MKNLRLLFLGLALVFLASACTKRYTCPTYLKNDDVKKKEVRG